jgi:Flp pilus assembly protein TadB
MEMTFVLVVCSFGVVLGIVGVVVSMRSSTIGGAEPTAEEKLSRLRQRPRGGDATWDSRRWITKVVLPLVSGLIVGTVTRWPVAALLAAAATALLPAMFRSTSSRDLTRRTEAVAVWTELLRDTLTASAGLAQSIVATAGVAPDELREPVTLLADRIMSGVPMDDALRLFALEVHDSSAEDVVAALRLAATSRAQRLVELLGALADSTRDEVTMRLRVEASRASARSGVRTVICFSIGFVALLMLVARSYLAPYGSITGQLVLVLVGVCYVAGLILMVRLVRPKTWRGPVGSVREGLRA